MKKKLRNTMMTVGGQHPFLFGIGALYVVYALVLVVTFAGAMIYDYVNGGNEAFHLVYKMQTFSCKFL
jgi:hypothetical protein